MRSSKAIPISLKYGEFQERLVLNTLSLDSLHLQIKDFLKSIRSRDLENLIAFPYIYDFTSPTILVPFNSIESLKSHEIIEIFLIDREWFHTYSRNHNVEVVKVGHRIIMCNVCSRKYVKTENDILQCKECGLSFHSECHPIFSDCCQQSVWNFNNDKRHYRKSTMLGWIDNIMNKNVSKSSDDVSNTQTKTTSEIILTKESSLIRKESQSSQQSPDDLTPKFRQKSSSGRKNHRQSCDSFKIHASSETLDGIDRSNYLNPDDFSPTIPQNSSNSKKIRSYSGSNMPLSDNTQKPKAITKTFDKMYNYVAVKKYLLNNKPEMSGYLYYKGKCCANMVKGYWMLFPEKILVCSNKTAKKIIEEIPIEEITKVVNCTRLEKEHLFSIHVNGEVIDCGVREIGDLDPNTLDKLRENGVGTEYALKWFDNLCRNIRKSKHQIAITWEESSSNLALDDADKTTDVQSTSDHQSDVANKYNIEEGGILGSGSYGTVFSALRKSDNLPVAIKCVEKKRYEINHLCNMFSPNNVVKNFKHPALLEILDVFEKKKFVQEVTEKQECDLLQKLMEGSVFSEHLTKFISFQVAAGLKFLHDMKVAHCDLKLENVLINKNCSKNGYPQVKLCDFECVKVFESESISDGHKIGTPSYWAPEVTGGSSYSTAIDYWSLGVLIYACLTMKTPFDCAKQFHNISDFSDDALYPENLFQTISVEAKNVMSSLLTVDPKLRADITALSQASWYNNSENIEELSSLENIIGQQCFTCYFSNINLSIDTNCKSL